MARITPGDRLREIARSALLQYDLRTADAVQLASALVWTKEHPRRRPFVCLDARLAAAARQAGFDVISS
ncbi:MAG TPA: hypothetical protein VNO70_23290 [Blastocatellia bacterium]|nr:hypothetical protein [Blastocatellia bacterium]